MLIVQCIGGFTQREGTWNGVLQLKERLLSELDEYSGLSVRVRFDPWSANWKQIARQMHLLRNQYAREPFVIVGCAFSWGAGNGIKRFAAALDRYGLEIEVAVLADGVFHSWLPRPLWFLELRAWLGMTRIKLPPNVRAMHGFYQRIGRPWGLEPSGNGQRLSWTELRLPHVEVDDAVEWHDKCATVCLAAARLAVGAAQNVPADAPRTLALESRLAPPKQ